MMPKKESAEDTPLTTPTVTPATADTMAEMAQLIANMWRTEMPSDCATCWSKAVARIARPIREYLKNQPKPAMIRIEMTRLIT
ncbi:hypothetical protein D3C71_1817480 [compost metagenome]